MSVNKVMLIGNLGADPETRVTQGEGTVTRFRIATSERWTSKDGHTGERTEWHKVVAFGRLAELCRDYLSKGRQVYVEGRLQTRSYEKDAVTRYVTEVIASVVEFLGDRRAAAKGEQAAESPAGAPDIGDI